MWPGNRGFGLQPQPIFEFSFGVFVAADSRRKACCGRFVDDP
jgi:hypothetical protein